MPPPRSLSTPLVALARIKVVGAVLLLGAIGLAQTTELVSVDSSGIQGNDKTSACCISGDGRHVVFASDATNLVPGDTNGLTDVFVRDLSAGVTERVSIDSSGVEGNGASAWDLMVSISADGRYLAFMSSATNLVPGDTNGFPDVFVRDRQRGTTEKVSLSSSDNQGNSISNQPSISADGRFVAFASWASNLVPDDTNGEEDVFVRDLQTGTTERVSVDSYGHQGWAESFSPAISANGRWVAFLSYAHLVSGYPGGVLATQVYVHDRQTGTTTIASVDSSWNAGDSISEWPSISGDGRHVAFQSYSANLVPGDTNGVIDVFVRDLQALTTELVSVSSSGVQGSKESYLRPCPISGDGRFVVFFSSSSELVPGDPGWSDVFIHDRQTGETEFASVAYSGIKANNHSGNMCSTSADGRYVAFGSWATNLVPGNTNGEQHVFLRDRGCGSGSLTYCTAGTSASGCQALLSASGAASATAPSGFTLSATTVEGQKDGLYFFGTNGRQANSWGNGTSYQCVVPPVVRAPLMTATGSVGLCDGSFVQDLNALWCPSCPKPAKNPGAGATVQAQLWYRDPLSTSNQTTSLSDGIEFGVAP